MSTSSSIIKCDIATEQQEGKCLRRFSQSSFPVVYFEKKEKQINSFSLYFVGNKDDSFFMSFHSNLTFLPSPSSLVSFRAGTPYLYAALKILSLIVLLQPHDYLPVLVPDLGCLPNESPPLPNFNYLHVTLKFFE